MENTKRKLSVKKSLFLIVVLFATFGNNITTAWASNTEQQALADCTLYSAATLEDNFDDDTILVVLTRNASRNFREFTVKDFPEVELTDVTCITPGLEQAKKQIATGLSYNPDSFSEESKFSIDTNEFRQILRLRLAEPNRENILKAVHILEQREDIRSAEPNYNFQGGNSTTNTDYTQWHATAIGLQQGHSFSSGANTIRVGVVSTGIDVTLPGLNGRVDAVSPRGANQPTGSQNFHPTDTTQPLADPAGHGTFIAGIIAGDTTGIAPHIRLVALKVATGPDFAGSYNINAIVEAIQYAGQNDPVSGGIRIPILSMSPNTWASNATMEQAITNFPGLFVKGAGNHGREITRPNDFNALTGDRIITVGSTEMVGTNEQMAVHSNWSNTNVCVFAPGSNIRSTTLLRVNATGFSNRTGTSYATPHVSATAALMLSVNPNLTPAQIRRTIMNNVDTLPNLAVNRSISGGRINVNKAVAAAAFTAANVSGGVSVVLRNGLTLPTGSNITIPDKIAPVGTVTAVQQNIVAIGVSAFSGQASLTQISIPASVTNIGLNAFKGCINLLDIDFGLNSQLHSIGDYAFQNCSSLTSINIPESLTTVGRTPFSGCVGLYNFIIPSSITENQHRWINPRGSLVLGNHNYVNGVCNICGHVGTGVHIHLYDEHLPGPPGKFGHQHYSYCDCGHSKLMQCLGEMPDYPPYDVFCLFCGQYMGGGGIMYSITLPNGITYISETPITFETFYQLSQKVGVSCDYHDYIVLSHGYYFAGELPLTIRKRLDLDN